MGQHLPLSVLFVVPYAPTRIRSRPFHLIRALASMGHRLTVATLWSNEEERAAVAAVSQNGAHEVVAEQLSRSRPLWNCARALLGPDPLQAHYSWSPALARRLVHMLDNTPFDVVHVEHLRGVRYALALANRLRGPGAGRVPIIWDSVDCISSLFRRAARESHTRRVRLAARLELRRTERYEGRMAPRFDRVLVTSETDRTELLELAQRNAGPGVAKRFEVVPNGVDLGYFTPPDAPRQPMTLVITGKMSYHANATAAVRFVEDVMPCVWAKLPDARLMIVGKDPPQEVVRLQGASGAKALDSRHAPPVHGDATRVVVTGTVDDIRPFLQGAALAIAPIQYGVGIQNKVLEALACGTPVVATPQAVSGLSARDGEDLVVGRSPEGLAAAIVLLLEDPDRRRRIGEAGRTYVERQHNWRQIAARLSDIYRDAIA
jgi:glycosyltransferase involved in cell wall biosynthesis